MLCTRARRVFTHGAEFLIAVALVSVISGTRYNMHDMVVRRGSNISARRYFGITGKNMWRFIQPFAGEPPEVHTSREIPRCHLSPGCKKINICHVNPAIYIKSSCVQRLQVCRVIT